ncbi:MAG TPA: DUF4136 domain-containing protein [Longimicrobiales bacterium]|nr:DUF4136 domain-containing protein [Longimicrobiales bacterium]
MIARRWAFLAGMAPALAGCGVPIQSGAHFASGWEPPGRTTFAWNDEADHTQGDVRLEGNTFFHARLHEAVEWELNLRGIRHSESNPTLLIHHHLSLSDHEMEREVIDESGIRTSETEAYEGASVVLHIVDARTGEDRWVAWAQANVEPALTNPETMRKWVYDLVGEMFDDWAVPARSVED